MPNRAKYSMLDLMVQKNIYLVLAGWPGWVKVNIYSVMSHHVTKGTMQQRDRASIQQSNTVYCLDRVNVHYRLFHIIDS